VKRFDFESAVYRPKRLWLDRHTKKAICRATKDAFVGATAITLLVFASTL
jgi:hypothetical protein